MQATIWHNPACGTSRKTLALLQAEPDLEVVIVDYLKTGFAEAKLRQLLADAGLSPAAALRLRGTDAAERGLDRADADTIIAAMVAHPRYVNRPFVETAKGVRLCRPQELVLDLL